MMIRLGKPYKIINRKVKQYERHYGFPADNALVVPRRMLDDEACCDVRWEDEYGLLHVQTNRVVAAENLAPLDEFSDDQLYELWQHYYAEERRKETGALIKPVAEEQVSER